MEDFLQRTALCTLAIMAALVVVAGASRRETGIRGPRTIPKSGPAGRNRGQSSNHPPVKWEDETT